MSSSFPAAGAPAHALPPNPAAEYVDSASSAQPQKPGVSGVVLSDSAGSSALNPAHLPSDASISPAALDCCQPFTRISCNPHCAQRLRMPPTLQLPPPRFLPLSALCRVLSSSSPRTPYCHIPHVIRSTNHWGQRKLLLSEIEFLSLFIPQLRARVPPPKRIIVIYAGAAPGTHIPYLFDLFDNKSGDLQFALFDPAFWNIWPRANARFCFDEISICPLESGSPNGFFTDDVARCCTLRLLPQPQIINK